MTVKMDMLKEMALHASFVTAYGSAVEWLDERKITMPVADVSMAVLNMDARKYSVLMYFEHLRDWLAIIHDKHLDEVERIRDAMKAVGYLDLSPEEVEAAAGTVPDHQPLNEYVDMLLKDDELAEVPTKFRSQLIKNSGTRAGLKYKKLYIARVLLRPKTDALVLTIDLDTLSPFHRWCALSMV